jgi:hypothetical protein
MKKPNNSKKATPAKKGAAGELEGKKPLKLKPIKSKEVKRSKNPSVFEDDDEGTNSIFLIKYIQF